MSALLSLYRDVLKIDLPYVSKVERARKVGPVNATVDCQMRQEKPDGGSIQFRWVAFVVKENEALNPVAIGLLGTPAEVSQASNITHLVE